MPNGSEWIYLFYLNRLSINLISPITGEMEITRLLPHNWLAMQVIIIDIISWFEETKVISYIYCSYNIYIQKIPVVSVDVFQKN